MSKIFLSCCLILSLATLATAAESDLYPYLGVTTGTALTSVNKLSDSSGSLNTVFKPGYMAGLVAGIAFKTYYDFNIEQIRVELEAGYRSSELLRLKTSTGQSAASNGRLDIQSFMINGYLDNGTMLASDLPVTIFLTVGAGVAVANTGAISYQGVTLVNSATDTQPAYQAGFGFGYEPAKKNSIDATYRYLATAPFNLAGVKADYGSHNILLGVRYAFR